MEAIDLSENEKNFLLKLFNETGKDQTTKVSMHDIGESIGLEREESSRTAEELIGRGMVEVKTLSGGIGITEYGVNEAGKLAGNTSDNSGTALGKEPVVDENGQKSVDTVASFIKKRTGNLGLNFEDLSEITADLKTIDVQLTSSRPKTAIIRECFVSILKLLQRIGDKAGEEKINALIKQ